MPKCVMKRKCTNVVAKKYTQNKTEADEYEKNLPQNSIGK